MVTGLDRASVAVTKLANATTRGSVGVSVLASVSPSVIDSGVLTDGA